MISIYKDTNTINANHKNNAINELEELTEIYPDKVMIEKTDALDTELLQSPRHNSSRLSKSDQYIESFGSAILGHSRLGHSVIGSDADEKNFSVVLNILFGERSRSSYTKQEIRDAMHVMTAIRYGGIYFITYDKKLLEKSNDLFRRFNSTIISTPETCLTKVKSRLKVLLQRG